MGTRMAALVALASLSLVACGDASRPATFEYIHAAIITPNCTTSGCHSDLAQAAGISLESREEACDLLTGGANFPRNYVDPGEPETSQLMYLLLGVEVSTAMPPDVRLPDAEIDLIEQWIVEGAPCQ